MCTIFWGQSGIWRDVKCVSFQQTFINCITTNIFFHRQQNHPNNLNPPGSMGVPAGSRSNRSSSTSNLLKPSQQRRLQVEQRLLNKSSSSSSTSNATQEFLARLRRMEIPQLKRPPPQHPTQNVVMVQVHRQQPSSSSRYLQFFIVRLHNFQKATLKTSFSVRHFSGYQR